MKKLSFIFLLSGIFVCCYFVMKNNEASHIKESDIAKKIDSKNNKIVDISRIIASEKKKLKASLVRPAITIKPSVINSKDKLKNNAKSKEEIDFSKLVFSTDLDFVELDNHYALPNSEVTDEYQVIEKRSTYSIVKSDFPVGDGSLSVVAVKGSKHLGIATGVLKVHLQNFSLKDSILGGFQYEVVEEYEHLSRVLYKLDNLEQATRAYRLLQETPVVMGVELEILQFERTER